jgi:hypothetical protein
MNTGMVIPNGAAVLCETHKAVGGDDVGQL